MGLEASPAFACVESGSRRAAGRAGWAAVATQTSAQRARSWAACRGEPAPAEREVLLAFQAGVKAGGRSASSCLQSKTRVRWGHGASARPQLLLHPAFSPHDGSFLYGEVGKQMAPLQRVLTVSLLQLETSHSGRPKGRCHGMAADLAAALQGT